MNTKQRKKCKAEVVFTEGSVAAQLYWDLSNFLVTKDWGPHNL